MKESPQPSTEELKNGFERSDMPVPTNQPQQNARLTGRTMQSDEGETEEQD